MIGAGLALLAFGGWLAADTSAMLVSAPPSSWFLPVIIAWLTTVGLIVVALGRVGLPRILQRMLAIAAMALAGWSYGTMTRALYSVVSFADAVSVGEAPSAWMVVGGDEASAEEARWRTVVSVTGGPSLSLPFDSGAIAEMKRGFACINLTIETTETGVARVRDLPGPLGANDILPCEGMR